MPGSTAAALNVIEVGDLVASVDGFFLSSSESAEDAVRLIDQPEGSVSELLLLREVPDAEVMHVRASVQRNWIDDGGVHTDMQYEESALSEDLSVESNPRSFDSASSSLSQSEVGQPTTRHRSFYSLGSFDTQISSPQQSPRGERRGTVTFREVQNFGDDDQMAVSQQPAPLAESGIGLFLKQLVVDDETILVVVSSMTPGGPAHASQRIMVGDALESVDGRGVDTFLSLDAIEDTLMGPEHSPVMLQLHRVLTSSSYTVTLVRRAE
jgi:C-terminal processing protease CtpA/Prc